MANKLFDEIDEDKSGFLDKDEVRKFSMDLMLLIDPLAEFNEAQFDEKFMEMDLNGDGVIDREELMQSQMVVSQTEEKKEEKATWNIRR